jgi:hemin uptake protein HemP
MYFSETDPSESVSPVSDPAESQAAVPAPTDDTLPMAARIINSKSLFGESRIIHIEHRGMIYRMSITNQNRLILQK